jgi:hypothetical protein
VLRIQLLLALGALVERQFLEVIIPEKWEVHLLLLGLPQRVAALVVDRH